MRQIKLDKETVSILKQWQKISQREKGSMSVAPLLSDGYIFTFVNRQGELEPLYQDYINNILNRVIRQYGLKKITPHWFSYTHATLMIESGVAQ